jgi:hypothetical protein
MEEDFSHPDGKKKMIPITFTQTPRIPRNPLIQQNCAKIPGEQITKSLRFLHCIPDRTARRATKNRRRNGRQSEPRNPPAHPHKIAKNPQKNPPITRNPHPGPRAEGPRREKPDLAKDLAIKPIHGHDAPRSNRTIGALGGGGRRLPGEPQGRARISRSAAAAARSCVPGEGSGGAPPGRIGAAVAVIFCGEFERMACGRREMSGAEGVEEDEEGGYMRVAARVAPPPSLLAE